MAHSWEETSYGHKCRKCDTHRVLIEKSRYTPDDAWWSREKSRLESGSVPSGYTGAYVYPYGDSIRVDENGYVWSRNISYICKICA